jgi:hypothetical protein
MDLAADFGKASCDANEIPPPHSGVGMTRFDAVLGAPLLLIVVIPTPLAAEESATARCGRNLVLSAFRARMQPGVE